MLQDLLDRIANGGLSIEVISINDLRETLDPSSPTARASKAMDWITDNEKVIRRMYSLMIDRNQPERAEKLKAWWTELCRPLNDVADTLPERGGERNREEDVAAIQKIADIAEPIVDVGRGVLRGIVDRQVDAMVQVDFDDLIT